MSKISIQDTKLLSLNDLMRIFSISKTTAYRIVYGRKIPFYKINRNIRFAEEDVINYLNNNRVEQIKNR
ncbi:MAG: helix-turn-helix domain-containing protein [Patescibacteria group bacterium]|jgi:predicted DNA-binding transcriptional regulator AlpA